MFCSHCRRVDISWWVTDSFPPPSPNGGNADWLTLLPNNKLAPSRPGFSRIVGARRDIDVFSGLVLSRLVTNGPGHGAVDDQVRCLVGVCVGVDDEEGAEYV